MKKKYGKNKHFIKVYRSHWGTSWGRFNASFWNKHFGNRHKLPMNTTIIHRNVENYSGNLMISLRLLHCNPYGVRKNRVQALCTDCNNWIPAGRISQHRCGEK